MKIRYQQIRVLSYGLALIFLYFVLSGCHKIDVFDSKHQNKDQNVTSGKSPDPSPVSPATPDCQKIDCSPVIGSIPFPVVETEELSLSQALPFEGCEQINDYFLEVQLRYEEIDKLYEEEVLSRQVEWMESSPAVMADSSMASNSVETAASVSTKSESAGASGDSFTNIQEAGVDESDYVKIGKNHIFVARPGFIKVLNRKNLGIVGDLPISLTDSLGLYVIQDRLVTLDKSLSEVRIYQLTEGQMPALLKKHRFSGSHVDDRVTGGRLVLAIRKDVPGVLSWNAQMVQIEPGLFSGLSCDRIIRPAIADLDNSITELLSVNLIDTDQDIQSIGIMGASDRVYMTSKNIYLMKESTNWHFHARESVQRRVVINKVNFNAENGLLSFESRGVVPGYVKDIWAFKELDEHNALSVTTTTGELTGRDENMSRNHLFTLKTKEGSQSLDIIGRVTDFGLTENIRSIRYIGQIAYVVTFKKTDPLYAIDLQNPELPTILSELKIPGFSTYMHPLNNHLLLGVGFDTTEQGDFALYQGVKLSLFNIENPRELKVEDTVILGERGSTSQISTDHHAFYYNSDENIIGVPVILLEQNRRVFSGAIFYQIAEGRFKELGRLSHEDMIPERCKSLMNSSTWWSSAPSADFDINRVFYMDSKYLAVSRFGISTHLAPTAEADQRQMYSVGVDECRQIPVNIGAWD